MVEGYEGVYNGNAYGATLVSAEGVNNEDLTSSVTVGTETFANVPGGEVDWSFEHNNYVAQSGTVDIIITKADATIVVEGKTVTYDGDEHGASGTATGVKGEALAGLDLGATFTNVPGGTANWTFTDETGNYNDDDGSVAIVINKADATIAVSGTTVTYDGEEHGATGSATGVKGEALAGLDLGAKFTNVPGGTANWTFTDVTGNYNDASGFVEIVINKANLSITADNKSKYVGQVNPTFTVSYDGFVYGENESVLSGSLLFQTDADRNSCADEYDIVPSGLTSGNYNIIFIEGTLVVTGLTIDASASSKPVNKNDATVSLSATVSPAVAGVLVNFYLDDAYEDSAETGTDGTATISVDVSGNLDVNVYKVTAEAGKGCHEDVAYMPVYDPDGGFVTGGGWINSPAGAYIADETVVGKANFGFNAKYKKGKSDVDGNTEFQFKAGDLNFKSQLHEAGSLVISGKKATYRGEGTINGLPGYKFVLVAIDGDWNGGTNPDEFRIKISTKTGDLIYDNGLGADENGNAATVLGDNGRGGGSIVIHEVKAAPGKNKSVEIGAEISLEEVPVLMPHFSAYPNPFSERLRFEFSPVEDAHARIDIFDMTGRLVKTIFNQQVETGVQYEAEFVPEGQINGTYIYRMVTGSSVQNGKVTYRK